VDRVTYALTLHSICNRLGALIIPVKTDDKYNEYGFICKTFWSVVKSQRLLLFNILSSEDFNVILDVCYEFGLSYKNVTYSLPAQ
jgi:hypothetical protein